MAYKIIYRWSTAVTANFPRVKGKEIGDVRNMEPGLWLKKQRASTRV